MSSKVYSFASGKGGVGKTTLVSNLGHLWARQGRKTLLIDGDWSLGKLAISLGVKPSHTIDAVLSDEKPLEEVITSVNPLLDFIAAPTGKVGFEELNEAARSQLFFDLDRVAENYSRVLLDHSSGVHWGVLPFAAASHEHIIITTPEPTSYTDAYAIMKILSNRFHVKNFGLLVTLSNDRAETEKIMERFSEVVRTHLAVRISLVDIIPWDPRFNESIRRQEPFVLRYPEDALTQQLQSIVHVLDRRQTPGTGGLSFGSRNLSLKQD